MGRLHDDVHILLMHPTLETRFEVTVNHALTVVLENLGARSRRHVERAEHILDRDRHTGEWPERVAGGALLVDALGGGEGIR